MKRLLFILLNTFFLAGFSQEVGLASYYHEYFNGKRTANGEIYDDKKMTCAHKTLPLGTMLKVINLENNKEVILRVNDRGPYVKDRILDLTLLAATKLGYVQKGMARVTYQILSPNVKIPEPITTDTAEARVEVTPKEAFYEVKKIDTLTTLHYGFKIASFDDAKMAFNMSNDLQTKYDFPVYIQTVKLQKGCLYRIYLGNFGTKDEADANLQKIRKSFKDSYSIEYGKF